ncbi:hypothetical protein AAULR_15984 [Lacticaseibacillus rhamnosus MTCC 5462]|nr:hypothetical protein AAULR_15984 [Lacticaseibacillus rhamnosus MTCC 5462]
MWLLVLTQLRATKGTIVLVGLLLVVLMPVFDPGNIAVSRLSQAGQAIVGIQKALWHERFLDAFINLVT